ncbi:hypothetical protein E5983_04830 [Streptococcus danieliae]|uniref:Uncharacterized protein n=1 Tax=Streptococcus danieliae TaxID=747656 RepID=A0A7X3G9P8_9STRE|nr:hypothetical protein [Streptococcus danieliae]MVX58971.1 hypothetical protein [Streptococcus danieliae]
MFYFFYVRALIKLMFLAFIGISIYILFQTIGLSMFFLLIVGLLAAKFVPGLVLPIILIAIGVHFTGGFSFIPDIITGTFWGIVFACLGFWYLEDKK